MSDELEPWDSHREDVDTWAERAIAAGVAPTFAPVLVGDEPALASAGVVLEPDEFGDLARSSNDEVRAAAAIVAVRRLYLASAEVGARPATFPSDAEL